MIIARKDHIPDIIPIKTGDTGTEASDMEVIFDAERQLTAEVARCRDPNGVVEPENLDEAMSRRRQQSASDPGTKSNAVGNSDVERRQGYFQTKGPERDCVGQSDVRKSFQQF